MEAVTSFRGILLGQQTTVDAIRGGNGDIQVRSRWMKIQDSSNIKPSTLAGKAGGWLAAIAKKLVKVIEESANDLVLQWLICFSQPKSKWRWRQF